MPVLYDIPQTIRAFLDQRGIHYQVIPHSRDFSAQHTAHDTFTPGRSFAKTVMICADNYYAMVVLPANRTIDFDQLRAGLGAVEVSLATESEIAELFPDCEVGAEPPFGSLYDMPVIVSHELPHQEVITFNGGNHEDAIRMSYFEFERLADPIYLDFTHP